MPISSMTGFAAASGQSGDSDWRWEVKSVNARGLDLRFRLPSGYEGLEPKLRAAAQKVFTRGSITLGLSTRYQSTEGRTSLDESSLAATIESLAHIRSRLEQAGLPVAPVQAETLLSLPGLVVSGDEATAEATEAVSADILAGFDTVLQALLTERRAEGERLARVISEQVAQIESLTRDAAACAEEAVLALRERLAGQLQALLADTELTQERFAQEAALLATKADVREEIDRLDAHVAAARDLLSLDEPAGRRLDFLAQEFNREANTLCSKSPTDALTRIGLSLKTVIDQFREQAANVE